MSIGATDLAHADVVCLILL